MTTSPILASEDDLGMIGSSAKICELRSKIRRAATTNASVLIIGETGTGKELVARAVHRLSNRSGKPLLCVNCGALNSQLLESELFGHAKGAFTGADATHKGKFECAEGGVLFLDEINSIGADFQVKLLRVVQDKIVTPVGSNEALSVDVRIVAASNQNLEEEARSGRFRPDLLYRLKIFPIDVPALRERGDDVVELAEYFMKKYGKEENKEFSVLSESTRRLLPQHIWPGNVRELEHVVHRAVIYAERSGPDEPLDISPELIAPPITLHIEHGHDGIADFVFDSLLSGQLPLEGLLQGDTNVGKTTEYIIRQVEAGLDRYLASDAGQKLLARKVRKGVVLERMGLSPRPSGNKKKFSSRLRQAIAESYERHASRE